MRPVKVLAKQTPAIECVEKHIDHYRARQQEQLDVLMWELRQLRHFAESQPTQAAPAYDRPTQWFDEPIQISDYCPNDADLSADELIALRRSKGATRHEIP